MNYDKIISYFKENEDVFNEVIEELDSYNGYLGDISIAEITQIKLEVFYTIFHNTQYQYVGQD